MADRATTFGPNAPLLEGNSADRRYHDKELGPLCRCQFCCEALHAAAERADAEVFERAAQAFALIPAAAQLRLPMTPIPHLAGEPASFAAIPSCQQELFS